MNSEVKCVLLVEGNSIERVSNLRSTLERIKGVSAVIVNIEMPGGEGITAFETISSAAPQIPILILSDPENESIAKQAAERGAQKYILKNNLQEFRLRRVMSGMIEQKEEEYAAFLQQQCSEATLACSGESVVISDKIGRITHLNSAAEKTTGWSRDEALGRSLDEVLQITESGKQQSADDALSAEPALDRNGMPCGNCILMRRNGVQVSTRHSTIPTRDRSGNVTGAVVLFHDVGAARARTKDTSSATR